MFIRPERKNFPAAGCAMITLRPRDMLTLLSW